MAKRVVHVGEGASVRDVIDAMKTHRITRVIVTNDAQQVVGIVTRSNLIRVFLEHLPMALPESETPSAAD